MHAFNFTAKKKVALACNSCTGWVGGAGNSVAVNSCVRSTDFSVSYFVLEKHLTVYLNSTKTGAGWLKEFSPRRLTILDICLDLVTWSVENHLGFG